MFQPVLNTGLVLSYLPQTNERFNALETEAEGNYNAMQMSIERLSKQLDGISDQIESLAPAPEPVPEPAPVAAVEAAEAAEADQEPAQE